MINVMNERLNVANIVSLIKPIYCLQALPSRLFTGRSADFCYFNYLEQSVLFGCISYSVVFNFFKKREEILAENLLKVTGSFQAIQMLNLTNFVIMKC